MREESPMAHECWFCGRPIRRVDRAETLPGGTIAVHADCVRQDADSQRIATPKKAA
jgi:hypothetical protein